jgi:hypothetical protein
MSQKEWITLIETQDRLQAEILREALQACEIPAQIFQEGAAQFAYPLSVGPLSLVQVCVPADRAQEAQAWLQDYLKGNLAADDEESEE